MSHILRSRDTKSCRFCAFVIMALKGTGQQLAEDRAYRGDDTIFARADVLFQWRAVGNRNIEGRDAAYWRFELVEPGLSDARCDLGGDAATLMRLIDDDDSARFFHGFYQ